MYSCTCRVHRSIDNTSPKRKSASEWFDRDLDNVLAFCTGAFDIGRDGVFDQYGWVADCYEQDVIAGQLLCPSSICFGSEKINRTSSDDGTGSSTKAPLARRGVPFKDGKTIEKVVSGTSFSLTEAFDQSKTSTKTTTSTLASELLRDQAL